MKIDLSSPVAIAEFSIFAGILTAALLQHHLLRFEIAQLEFHHPPTSFAHLTSCSKMSGSRRVVTPSWLSGSWRSFLYGSSVCSCHLFLISSASVSPYHLYPLLCPSLHEMFPCISNFLEEISSLSHSIVFLYSFALILRKTFLSLLAVLWNSAFKWISFLFSFTFASLLFLLFVRPPQTAILLFWHFFFSLMVLLPVSCTMSQTSIHSSSGTLGTLSDLGP